MNASIQLFPKMCFKIGFVSLRQMAKSIGPQLGFAAAAAALKEPTVFYTKTGLVPWQQDTPELPRFRPRRRAQRGSAEPRQKG